MSQEGIIDVVGSNPQIPTDFIANVGNAVPIANTLEILGSVVTAGTHPLRTIGSGNTIDIQAQISQAVAATDATKIGLSNFNSAQFTVDGNGFVSLLGTGTVETFTVDAFTAPGTNPVTPNLSGNITVTGGQVAAGTTTNVIQTNSLAANTYAVQIQRSSAQATTTIGANGVSHFSSAMFSVDANGFVTLSGGGQAIDSVAVQTGTSPIAPTVAGLITINGATVAAGTNPVRTDGTGANTLAVEVQISQALASTDATKIGLSNFNSSQFSVDANGFVSTSGTGVANTITGNSGGALSPTAGNWNIVGTGSITTSGSASTLTAQLTGLTNHAVLIGAGTATITSLGPTSTAGQVLQSAGSSADPAFSTATYPLTTTINQILYSSAANTITGLGTANNGVLITSATGVPSILPNGTTGQILTATTGSPPSWISPATSGTVTSVSVTSANGFAGTVATATTTPAITISTTITGVISGNGTAISGSAVTQHDVLVGGATNAITSVSPSTAGLVLTSNGVSADPSFQATQAVAPTVVKSVISQASAITVSSGTPTNITSISLTAGTWYISATLMNNSTLTTNLQAAINTVSGTMPTNLGDNFSWNGGGNLNSATINCYVVTPGSTTIYYLNTSTAGTGTLTVWGNITAFKFA